MCKLLYCIFRPSTQSRRQVFCASEKILYRLAVSRFVWIRPSFSQLWSSIRPSRYFTTVASGILERFWNKLWHDCWKGMKLLGLHWNSKVEKWSRIHARNAKYVDFRMQHFKKFTKELSPKKMDPGPNLTNEASNWYNKTTTRKI